MTELGNIFFCCLIIFLIVAVVCVGVIGIISLVKLAIAILKEEI